MSTSGPEIAKWCTYTVQASFIMNTTYHLAIKMTPYEAVFHMKAKRELLDHAPEEDRVIFTTEPDPKHQKREKRIYSRSTERLQYQNDQTV